MGQLISSVLGMLEGSEKQHEEETIEQLQILQKMVSAKFPSTSI
jgi:hypothetical protein